MSSQRAEWFNALLAPLLLGVALSLYLPNFEREILYIVSAVIHVGHLDYAVSIVNELCDHFKIYCFSLEKRKN